MLMEGRTGPAPGFEVPTCRVAAKSGGAAIVIFPAAQEGLESYQVYPGAITSSRPGVPKPTLVRL